MQNFAYKKNIKGIEVNKRGYFNFQNLCEEVAQLELKLLELEYELEHLDSYY